MPHAAPCPAPPVLFPPDADVLGCSDHSARKAQRAALGTTGMPQAAQGGAARGILVPCGGKVPVKGEEGIKTSFEPAGFAAKQGFLEGECCNAGRAGQPADEISTLEAAGPHCHMDASPLNGPTAHHCATAPLMTNLRACPARANVQKSRNGRGIAAYARAHPSGMIVQQGTGRPPPSRQSGLPARSGLATRAPLRITTAAARRRGGGSGQCSMGEGNGNGSRVCAWRTGCSSKQQQRVLAAAVGRVLTLQ